MSAACVNCGEPLELDAIFCSECGAKQETVCPRCGATVDSGASFCGECGSAVSIETAVATRQIKKTPANPKAQHQATSTPRTIDTENEAEAAEWDANADEENSFLWNPYFVDAIDVVRETGDATAANLQQQLRIAPERAGKYLAKLEAIGIVSPLKKDGTRDIRMPEPEVEEEILEDWREALLDPLYREAVELVISNNRVSISLLQRTFRIGYSRTARLIEAMEAEGIVSPKHPDGTRQVTASINNGVVINKPISSGIAGLLSRLFKK